MKGQTTIEVNGKQVPLKFTLGVSEDLNDYAAKNNIEDVDNDPKGTRIMFALMELYATEDEWMCDDILDKAEKRCIKYKALGIDQIQVINALVEEATEGLDLGNVGKTVKKKK